MKYKTSYKYDTKVFNLKTSHNALKNCSGLRTKQPCGSVSKQIEQSLSLRVSKGNLIAENVYDLTIDRITCSLCGKANCKVNSLNIPQNTLTRFYQENFSCEKIVDCIKANKLQYLKSDKVKLGILTLGYELSEKQLIELFTAGENIGLKGLELLIKSVKSNIRHNQLLLENKVIETKLIKITPFVKTSSKLDNLEIDVILTSKNDRRLIKSKKIESIQETSFIYPKLSIQQTIQNDRLFLSKLEKDKAELLTYKIPSILTLEQENELIQNAEILKGKKRKFALHKVRFTDSFLSNYNKPDLPLLEKELKYKFDSDFEQPNKNNFSFVDSSGIKHNCKTLKGAIRVFKKL